MIINGHQASEINPDPGLRQALTEKMMERPMRNIHQLTGTIYAIRDEKEPIWKYYTIMF